MGGFWQGFEKRAGVMNTLGRVTGASRLKKGINIMSDLNKNKLIKPGEGWSGAFKPTVAEGGLKTGRKLKAGMGNLASGATRLGATAAVGGTALYAGNKMLGGSSQSAQPGYY